MYYTTDSIKDTRFTSVTSPSTHYHKALEANWRNTTPIGVSETVDTKSGMPMRLYKYEMPYIRPSGKRRDTRTQLRMCGRNDYD